MAWTASHAAEVMKLKRTLRERRSACYTSIMVLSYGVAFVRFFFGGSYDPPPMDKHPYKIIVFKYVLALCDNQPFFFCNKLKSNTTDLAVLGTSELPRWCQQRRHPEDRQVAG